MSQLPRMLTPLWACELSTGPASRKQRLVVSTQGEGEGESEVVETEGGESEGGESEGTEEGTDSELGSRSGVTRESQVEGQRAATGESQGESQGKAQLESQRAWEREPTDVQALVRWARGTPLPKDLRLCDTRPEDVEGAKNPTR